MIKIVLALMLMTTPAMADQYCSDNGKTIENEAGGVFTNAEDLNLFCPLNPDAEGDVVCLEWFIDSGVTETVTHKAEATETGIIFFDGDRFSPCDD